MRPTAAIRLPFRLALALAGLVLACTAALTQARAAETTFDDWFLIDAADQSGDVIAGTSTPDGKEILGYRCFLSNNTCIYVLLTKSHCEVKGKYPYLLNAPDGAWHITAECVQTDDSSSQLRLSPYKNLETALQAQRGIIGIAMPMQTGQFRAVRFSLSGGRDATRAAELLARARANGRGVNPPANAVPTPGSSTF